MNKYEPNYLRVPVHSSIETQATKIDEEKRIEIARVAYDRH